MRLCCKVIFTFFFFDACLHKFFSSFFLFISFYSFSFLCLMYLMQTHTHTSTVYLPHILCFSLLAEMFTVIISQNFLWTNICLRHVFFERNLWDTTFYCFLFTPLQRAFKHAINTHTHTHTHGSLGVWKAILWNALKSIERNRLWEVESERKKIYIKFPASA